MSRADPQECPVCYEPPAGTARTLSCGHVFCHDCLVQTLLSASGRRAPRDVLVCPVCRHVTFIASSAEGKQNLSQTLRLPAPAGPARLLPHIRWPGAVEPLGVGSACTPHIFIISTQGRPLAEEDTVSVGTQPGEQLMVTRPRMVARICTSARCLLLMLLLFSLVALIAATLPWVLLG